MTGELFATAAKGLEDLLATELRSLGAEDVATVRAGVAFRGSAVPSGYMRQAHGRCA